jgi:1-acyl-sn-glycerol-3-phosphate acyltransferase
MENSILRISNKKKQSMTDEELGQYYDNLRQYYFCLPFDKEKVKKSSKKYRQFSMFCNLFSIAKRAKYLNKELLLNERGLIFVSNHIGSYDQFYIDRLLRQHKYSPHYLVKEKVKCFFIRWNLIYKHVGVIVVNQESIKSWQSAKEEIIKYLLNGRSVFIFPEGTRRGENNIGDFSSSVAQIAQESGVKIVTMAIKNSEKLFYRNPIVCCGKTIEVGVREDIKVATERIKSAVLNAYSEIMKYENKNSEVFNEN